MTAQRLILHIGMGKTGTTALQIAFARNRDLLRDCGVEYPEHASDQDAIKGNIVSGNGLGIISYLAPLADVSEAAWVAARDRLISSVRESRCHTVLYSSELLYNFRSDRLKELVEEVAEMGASVEIALYLRDIAGHALSSYSQDVKRGLYAGTLAEYLARPYAPRVMARLDALSKIIGGRNVQVYRWDSHRERIVQHFLTEVLGLESAEGFAIERQNVNRSLTNGELEAMRFMNLSLSGKRAARLVSDALISGPPLGEITRSMTIAEVDILKDRFKSEVDCINETMLTEDNLQLVGGVTTVEARSREESFTSREYRFMECLVRLANSVAGADVRNGRV